MQLFFHVPKVSEAFRYAVLAHADQMYGHHPYFVHLLQVAENLPTPTENELVAAMLHDVVEDTSVRIADVSERFGDPVAEIVDLVTKNPLLSYDQNIDAIIMSKNRSAMKVKWADNLANMTADKSGMSADRRERLTEKYTRSFALLSSALGI